MFRVDNTASCTLAALLGNNYINNGLNFAYCSSVETAASIFQLDLTNVMSEEVEKMV